MGKSGGPELIGGAELGSRLPNQPTNQISDKLTLCFNGMQNRDADNFSFLLPKNRRDKQGRKPDHADFDPTTLKLPESFPTVRLGNGETKIISGNLRDPIKLGSPTP